MEGIEIPFPHRTLYTGSVTKPFPIQLVGKNENAIDDIENGGQEKRIKISCSIGCKSEVDCSRLNNITSYGLGVLVRLHSKLAKIGGDVKLACVKGLIEQVFKVTHLNRIFEMYPDVSRACLMFRPKDTKE